MNWLTLTLGQVAAFSAAAAALALWLYLRQPRALKLRVSTLRFWANTPSASSEKRRLRLREAWPFLAQSLFLLALIAALGNPRRGAVLHEGRSVAMVLDSSAWSQMQPRGGSSWLEEIRREATNFLGRLPAGDRVLLLRADADGAPILSFTTDRTAVARAIADLQSSSAAPDVPRALAQGLAALGDSAQSLLVYVGPGITDDKQVQQLSEFRHALDTRAGTNQTQFLVRLVEDTAPLENRGITRLALKRSEERPNGWSLLTELKNYEGTPAEVTLSLSVNGQVFRREKVSLAGNESNSVTDDFTSPQGGLLQAEISPEDELNADNRAAIELPSSRRVSVAVLTSRQVFAEKLRAVLFANPYVWTQLMIPGVTQKADVMIYDGVVPSNAPAANSISFPAAPPGSSLHRVRLANWNAEHPVTRWIQSRDVSVRVAGPLKTQQGDTVLASSAGASPEPLILGREENGYRSVIVGFDPLDSNFTMEPAFPLLMAASVEWMTRPVGEEAEGLNAGALDFPGPVASIVAPSGRDVPFARNGYDVHLFAAESGLYRLTGPGGAASFVANVPPLPTVRWNPTTEEEASIDLEPIAAPQHDLWRWFVGIALLALWMEWRLFYFVRANSGGRSGSKLFPIHAARADDSAEHRLEETRKYVVRTP